MEVSIRSVSEARPAILPVLARDRQYPAAPAASLPAGRSPRTPSSRSRRPGSRRSGWRPGPAAPGRRAARWTCPGGISRSPRGPSLPGACASRRWRPPAPASGRSPGRPSARPLRSVGTDCRWPPSPAVASGPRRMPGLGRTIPHREFEIQPRQHGIAVVIGARDRLAERLRESGLCPSVTNRSSLGSRPLRVLTISKSPRCHSSLRLIQIGPHLQGQLPRAVPRRRA